MFHEKDFSSHQLNWFMTNGNLSFKNECVHSNVSGSLRPTEVIRLGNK